MMNNTYRDSRNKSLRQALFTAVLARLAGIALQVVSLPIAAATLGPELFSVYSMLNVVLAWTSLSNLGISQATTLHISREANAEKKLQVFSASIVMIAFLTSIVFFMGVLFFYWTPVLSWIFEAHVSDINIVYKPIIIVGFIFLITQYLSVFEAAQLAAQRQAEFNIATSVGTALAAGAVYWVSQNFVSVLGVILAVHVPVVVLRVINARNVLKSFGLTVTQLFSVRINDIRSVFRDGLSFVSGGPVSNFLCHPLSIVLVGAYSESLVTASYAAVISAIILVASFFSFVISPFRGALPEARRKGDYDWIRRMYWLTLSANLTYASVPFILLTFFGQPIFEVWYQGSVSPHHLILLASGLYVLCLAIEVTNYNFLSSLGCLQSASRWLLFKSISTAAVVWFLAFSENSEYIFFGMFFVAFLFSVIPLSVLVLMIIKRKSMESLNNSPQ